MSVLIEFSMFPTDIGESKSHVVAGSIEIIEKSGLPYKTGAMGTTIEGEWDEVMAVVKECFETMRPHGNRIYMGLKMDYRKDKDNRLKGKIESLEEKLGKKINQ